MNPTPPTPSTPNAAGASPPALAARPDHVPEKFWDAEAGQLRGDALARSYVELERKLGSAERTAADQPVVPAGPDAYVIDTPHRMFEADPEINRRLHQAGFTARQAQLVYDLAAERLMPLVSDLARDYESSRQTDRLVEHFGGEAKWQSTARQITAWARAHLPPPVAAALSTTYDGVIAMHRMMGSDEPTTLGAGNGAAALDESELRRMIRDPRYWRERDASWIARVGEGYKRLYPGSAA